VTLLTVLPVQLYEMFSEQERGPHLEGEIRHLTITGTWSSGGKGEVYLADDSVLNRCGVKLLPPGLTEHVDRPAIQT
jgi:hypothetical protein